MYRIFLLLLFNLLNIKYTILSDLFNNKYTIITTTLTDKQNLTEMSLNDSFNNMITQDEPELFLFNDSYDYLLFLIKQGCKQLLAKIA